jgi:threonyl-tRNA synthetase
VKGLDAKSLYPKTLNPNPKVSPHGALSQTFWHSSAHVLGEALEAEYGVDLTIGPSIEEGFYYDCYMEDRVLSDVEKPQLEKRIEQVCLRCIRV